MGDINRMTRSQAFVDEFAAELSATLTERRGHSVTIGVNEGDWTVRDFISLGACSWEYMGVASIFDPDDDEDEMLDVAESVSVILGTSIDEVCVRFEKAGLVKWSDGPKERS